MFRIRSARIGNLDGRVRQSLWPFVRPDLFQKFNRQSLITLKRSFKNILELFRMNYGRPWLKSQSNG